MIRLGVNIDHVATLRNARGTHYPEPIHAAALAELGGADNITCHLREDRRHIKDEDVLKLKDAINVALNFEIASTAEMIEMALKIKPVAVTLVPERRQELTTEGGLDTLTQQANLTKNISRLKESGILVSLFVEADQDDIKRSSEMGADAIEIHTGHFCLAIDASHKTSEKLAQVQKLQRAAVLAHELGLQVHVGHGLHYANAGWIQHIPYCEEANIGHAIVSRSIMVGMKEACIEMKQLINNPAHKPYI